MFEVQASDYAAGFVVAAVLFAIFGVIMFLFKNMLKTAKNTNKQNAGSSVLKIVLVVLGIFVLLIISAIIDAASKGRL